MQSQTAKSQFHEMIINYVSASSEVFFFCPYTF